MNRLGFEGRKGRVRVKYLSELLLQVFRFYPRDAMLARVFAIATCPSVCLSAARRYCA